MQLNQDIKQFIAECEKKRGPATSVEMLNEWVNEYMELKNNAPQSEFEGYSSNQMSVILHQLWSEQSPVQLKEMSEEDMNSIPLFRQMMFLTDYLQREGKIKLTATKAIPPKIVKEMYALGAKDPDIESGLTKLTKELDSVSVNLTHILLKIMKVIKEQKGIMTLTKQGEKLIENHQLFVKKMLQCFTHEFNFAYLDDYPSERIGNAGCGFSIILLAKYGDLNYSFRFYAAKYFDAFPVLLEESDPQEEFDYEWGEFIYSLRTFDRFMYYLGWIEMEKTIYPIENTQIIKTPLFDKMIKVILPK